MRPSTKKATRIGNLLFACFGVLLIAAVASAAQITVTALRGIVKDPSGAVIPGVELTLKDMATGIEKTTQSIEDGGYLFANLVDGKYRLTATFGGFQTAVYDSIVINTGR